MIDALLSIVPGGGVTAALAALVTAALGAWGIFAAGKKSERAARDRERLDAVQERKDKADEVDQLGPADLDGRFERWMRDHDG